jgi:hypothetical protein
MSEGWIALHRGWRDNPVFRGEFSRADAWIWLVERACWKPTRYDIKGKTVTLQRGQLCASREQMAEAWDWSPSAVERFLTRLKTEQMIERETGQGKSVITVCNYAKYQDRAELTGQETEQPTGQRSDRDRTAKEQGNKGTREKEPNGSSLSARVDPGEVFDAWNRMAATTDNPTCNKRTPKRLTACRARLRDDGLDAILKAIEHVPRSSFLRGETGNWAGADIDFLLRPDSVTKILEGKYDDRPKQPGPSHSQSGDRRDGVAKALDRRIELGGSAGPTGRYDAGPSGLDRALPAPRLAAVR